MATTTTKKQPAEKAPTAKTPAADSTKRKPMTTEHKEALAQGRKAAAAVGAYLEALELAKPRRGRQVSKEDLENRLEEARVQVEGATGLAKLNAAQTVLDLENRLAALDAVVDLQPLEDEFVEWARVYADNKGVTYTAFRDVGVPPQVLAKAGIARTRRS